MKDYKLLLEFSFLTEPAAKEFGNLSTAGSERKEFVVMVLTVKRTRKQKEMEG